MCVCVIPFQVALTCSMHPTVRPKRTSQSLTACALPPLSPLVLTHVFVFLLTTESVLFFPLCLKWCPSAGHRHAHVSSFVCKYHQTWAKTEPTRIFFFFFLNSWWFFHCRCNLKCSSQIKWWRNSCLLWSGPISVWCNLMRLLCVYG